MAQQRAGPCRRVRAGRPSRRGRPSRGRGRPRSPGPGTGRRPSASSSSTAAMRPSSTVQAPGGDASSSTSRPLTVAAVDRAAHRAARRQARATRPARSGLDVELDVEPVALRRVARLGRLDRPAVPIEDDAPLDEQRIARRWIASSPASSAVAALGGDRAGPAAQDDAGPAERLVERAGSRSAAMTASAQARSGPPTRGRSARHRPGAGGAAGRSAGASDAEAGGLGGRRGTDVAGQDPRARDTAGAAHLLAEGHQAIGAPVRRWRRRSCRARAPRMRPSSASRCMALRAVIRLTPNSAHRSASDGQPLTRREAAIRSRSACSIWR